MVMVLTSPESRARPKEEGTGGQRLAYSPGDFSFRQSCFRQNKLPWWWSPGILGGFVPGDVIKHQARFSSCPCWAESNGRKPSEDGVGGTPALPPSPAPFLAQFFPKPAWVSRRLISCLCKAGD